MYFHVNYRNNTFDLPKRINLLRIFGKIRHRRYTKCKFSNVNLVTRHKKINKLQKAHRNVNFQALVILEY